LSHRPSLHSSTYTHPGVFNGLPRRMAPCSWVLRTLIAVAGGEAAGGRRRSNAKCHDQQHRYDLPHLLPPPLPLNPPSHDVKARGLFFRGLADTCGLNSERSKW
jgi:hypothetical protein